MEFYGQVIEVLPQRSGQSANGNWVSQDYVVQSKPDNYGRSECLCFSVFGQDRIDRFKVQLGQWVTVYAAVTSTKSQKTGTWFYQVRAYDVRLDPANGNAPGAPAYQQVQQPMQQPTMAVNGANAQQYQQQMQQQVQQNVANNQQAPFGGAQQPLPFG